MAMPRSPETTSINGCHGAAFGRTIPRDSDSEFVVKVASFSSRKATRVSQSLVRTSLPPPVPRFPVGVAAFLCGMLIVCGPAVKAAGELPGNHPRDSALRFSASKKLPPVQSPSGGTAKSPATSLSRDATSPSETSPSAAATETKEDVIEVVLTFDDGPHARQPTYGKNYTQEVVRTLKDNLLQKNIKAGFFVQTHAPGRGATPIGQAVIVLLARQRHVIGIHTGSTADHASHFARVAAAAYDANRNGVVDAADGANGLESDMIRAKARIRRLAGSDCLYVRPTYGQRNVATRAVYRRQGLKMILWDIDSKDNTGSPSVDDVNRNIQEGMRTCLAAGKNQIVILFHDINSRTALNLEEYLANICIAARELGKTVVFPTTTARVIEILNARADQ